MTGILKVDQIKSNSGTTGLLIEGNGAVNAPGTPRFFATGNNGAYVNTTPIPFPNVIIDNRNGWNTSTNIYTVPVSGDYFVSACIGIVKTTGSTGYGFAEIQHNGNNVGYSYIESYNVTAYHPLSVTRLFTCAANDTLNIRWGGSNGEYYNNIRECRLTIHMLG